MKELKNAGSGMPVCIHRYSWTKKRLPPLDEFVEQIVDRALFGLSSR